MKKIALLLLLAFPGVIILSLVGENKAEHRVLPVTDQSEFENGDLVLRMGKGFISDLFCNTSLSKREYSHAGFLLKGKSKWYVIHMIGNDNNAGFRIEYFSEFVNERENKAYAIYRYNFMNDHRQEMRQHLRKLQKQMPAFDDHFSMESDHELYCSEMIYKTIDVICNIQLPVTNVQGMKYVAIDNLYPDQLTQKITEVVY